MKIKWKYTIPAIIALIISIVLAVIGLTGHPTGAVNIAWGYDQPADNIRFAVYKLIPDSSAIDLFQDENFVPMSSQIADSILIKDNISSSDVEIWFDHPAEHGIVLDGQMHYFAMKSYYITTGIYSTWSDVAPVLLKVPASQNVTAEQK